MEYVKLEDVYEIIMGQSPDSKSYNKENIGLPFYQGNADFGLLNPTPTTWCDEPKKIAEKGDILISVRAPIGDLNIATEKCCIGRGLAALRNKGEVDAKYIYRFLFSRKKYLDGLGTGTTFKAIGKSILHDLQVPLPPKDQQQKIATHLDNITEAINNKKQQLALFDELAKSKFVEMFGDLETNPKNWNVVNFDYAAKIDGVMTTDYEKYADYPHIGIDSIARNTGELVGYRTVKEDNVISGKYLFSPEHIIYSKIRPNLNKVALPDFSGLCSADSYPILVNSGKCNRYYFAYVLRSDFFLGYILTFSSRAGIPKVNQEQIRGFEFPLPPLPLQNEFAAFAQKCDRAKSTAKQEISALQELLNSKMQEYFG